MGHQGAWDSCSGLTRQALRLKRLPLFAPPDRDKAAFCCPDCDYVAFKEASFKKHLAVKHDAGDGSYEKCQHCDTRHRGQDGAGRVDRPVD